MSAETKARYRVTFVDNSHQMVYLPEGRFLIEPGGDGWMRGQTSDGSKIMIPPHQVKHVKRVVYAHEKLEEGRG